MATAKKAPAKKQAAKKTAGLRQPADRRAPVARLERPEAPTDASQWKGKKVTNLLSLPSGNAMELRRVGLEVFVQSGKVPNSLLPMMEGALKGKRMEMKANEMETSQVLDMLVMFDLVMTFCAVAPSVFAVPQDGEARHPDRLYVDEIDNEDKAFVFQWVVGGTADVERFRDQLADSVDAVSAE